MRWTLAALIAATLPLGANENGLPVAHTGAFGQPTCAACHRPTVARDTAVRFEVGSYVPGATQQVRVIIEARGASRWGFQVTARRANDPSAGAGTFSATNQFVTVRCADGRLAPCGENQIEYATHTSVGAAGGGQAGRQIYGFEWRAPAQDVGPIVFAIAALAADGDRGTNGDTTATATTTSLHGPTNPPTIRSAQGALHAAALQRPQQTIAPKQLLSVFGSNLNNAGAFVAASTADFDVEGRLPSELSKLSFEFVTPGDPVVRLGRMVFVSDTQANLQAPDLPVGAGVVRIRPVLNRGRGAAEVRGAEIQAAVARVSAGLFTFGNGANGFAPGEGPAAAVNGVTGQLVAPPSLGIPNAVRARPGDIVLLFGTGFGPTTPVDYAEGEPAGAASLPGVSATVGGAPATVQYAGTAPSFVGLNQFNLVVPNLAPGEHPVVVRLDSFATQERVTLSVGP